MAFACLLFYRIDSESCRTLVRICGLMSWGRKRVEKSSLSAHIDCLWMPSCTIDCTQQVDEWMSCFGFEVRAEVIVRGCRPPAAPAWYSLLSLTSSNWERLKKKKKQASARLHIRFLEAWCFATVLPTTLRRMIQRILWSWAVHRLLQLSLGFQHTHSVRTCSRMNRGRCSYPHSQEGR